MPLDGPDFIRVCMALLGLEETEQTRFAEAIGLGYSGPSNVNRWLSGLGRPTYKHLMPLLARMGFLTEEALSLWEAPNLEEARRRVDAARRRAAVAEAGSTEERAAGLAGRAGSPRGRRRSA